MTEERYDDPEQEVIAQTLLKIDVSFFRMMTSPRRTPEENLAAAREVAYRVTHPEDETWGRSKKWRDSQ